MFEGGGDHDRSASTPRERRRRETLRDIVEAAWRLARRDGLASISMRDLGKEVGLGASSLYAYVDSKSALYDLMFQQGQHELAAVTAARPDVQPDDRRTSVRAIARRFMAFCTEDPVRYQLLFQRVIPDWEPSPEAYALAVERIAELEADLRALGIDDPRAVDLLTALLTGLTSQQIANDPGGDRWARLVDDAVDMFLDHLAATSEAR